MLFALYTKYRGINTVKLLLSNLLVTQIVAWSEEHTLISSRSVLLTQAMIFYIVRLLRIIIRYCISLVF